MIGAVKSRGPGNSINEEQVPHEKNGEQLPSCLLLWLGVFDEILSDGQLSIGQQGINVPAVVIKSNMKTIHFFIRCKGKRAVVLITNECLYPCCRMIFLLQFLLLRIGYAGSSYFRRKQVRLQALRMKKAKLVLIIKIGSSVITDEDGNLSTTILENIVSQTSQLLKQYNIILVSSGAVSSGKKWLKKYNRHLSQRKAAAAIGNPLLMKEYSVQFLKYGYQVAQALLERQHFARRTQFLQLKETIFELWQNDIIPVVNENDVVSNFELQFSDNDELATLLAVSFNANVLLFCTSAGGYKDEKGTVIPFVEDIDDVIRFLRKDTSAHGTGGMSSKLTFTKLATGLGIKVVYCGIQNENSFITALKKESGTTFKPKPSTLNERQKWLASGSITIGSLEIDEGAYKALQQRKSLLLVGVSKIEGSFSAGEVVQLTRGGAAIVGVAKMRFSASELTLKKKNIMAAHADDIVIF